MPAQGRPLRLTDFPVEGIASPAEVNIPEPGGNSVGFLLSRCYGINPRRRRFDTNLLILFEAVAWFFGFWAEHSFWVKLKGVLDLGRGNRPELIQKVVDWYCERRKAFHRLHEQRHEKFGSPGHQPPSRIVEIIDQINSRKDFVKSFHTSDNTLKISWSTCAASWPAQLDAILQRAESPLWPTAPPLLDTKQAQPQITISTHSGTMTMPSTVSMASLPQPSTNSSQPAPGSPLQKTAICPEGRGINNWSSATKARPKTLTVHGGNSYHSCEYDKSTDQFSGHDSSLKSPEATGHRLLDSTTEMVQAGSRSSRHERLGVMNPARGELLFSRNRATINPEASEHTMPGRHHMSPDLLGGASKRLGIEQSFPPASLGPEVDSPYTDMESEKSDRKTHEYVQSRKRQVCFSDVSTPRKKLQLTPVNLDVASKDTHLTRHTSQKSWNQGSKTDLSDATALLDATNQPDFLSSEATDMIRKADQNRTLEDSNKSSRETELVKLNLGLGPLLSNYQTKSAAIRVASQSDERIVQLECRVQRLDKIECQLRALQDFARQIQTPGHAETTQTVSTDTAKPPAFLPSAGSEHLQYLKSREVGFFLSGISIELAKLQSVIRHKIRQQEETNDGWKKMGHLADVLWILDDAFAKATKSAKAV